jgi:hypothetical protein
MMMTTIQEPTQKARSITCSRKKKMFVHMVSPGAELNTASYWDSGSRHQYFAYNIRTGASNGCPTGVWPKFEAKYALKPDEILVQVGTFQGKPATPTLWVPSDLRADVENVFGRIVQEAW